MHYALKTTTPENEEARGHLINEIGLMRSLDSDFIVQCVEAYYFSNRFWIILEIMEAGKLTAIVKDLNGRYSEQFCKYVIYCVAQGVKALHDKQIIHGDIKSDNVLVKYTGEIKLADFCFSQANQL